MCGRHPDRERRRNHCRAHWLEDRRAIRGGRSVFRRCVARAAASAQRLLRARIAASRRAVGATKTSPCSTALHFSRSHTTRPEAMRFLRHPPFPWSPARQRNPVQRESPGCFRKNPRLVDIRETRAASREFPCATLLRFRYTGTASAHSAARCISGESLRVPGRAPRVPGPRCLWRCGRGK